MIEIKTIQYKVDKIVANLVFKEEPVVQFQHLKEATLPELMLFVKETKKLLADVTNK